MVLNILMRTCKLGVPGLTYWRCIKLMNTINIKCLFSSTSYLLIIGISSVLQTCEFSFDYMGRLHAFFVQLKLCDLLLPGNLSAEHRLLLQDNWCLLTGCSVLLLGCSHSKKKQFWNTKKWLYNQDNKYRFSTVQVLKVNLLLYEYCNVVHIPKL